MPRMCSICGHPQRLQIDAALRAGQPLRHIAKHYGTSPTALFRHKQADQPGQQVPAAPVARQVAVLSPFERLRAIQGETAAILQEARATQNHVVALQAIARAERQIELEARWLGSSEACKAWIGIPKPPPEPPPVRDLASLTDAELEFLTEIQKKLAGPEASLIGNNGGWG